MAAFSTGHFALYHAAMPDLAVLLILVVIWRGPKTLPEIGRMLGRGVRNAREEAKSLRPDEPDPTDKTGQ